MIGFPARLSEAVSDFGASLLSHADRALDVAIMPVIEKRISARDAAHEAIDKQQGNRTFTYQSPQSYVDLKSRRYNKDGTPKQLDPNEWAFSAPSFPIKNNPGTFKALPKIFPDQEEIPLPTRLASPSQTEALRQFAIMAENNGRSFYPHTLEHFHTTGRGLSELEGMMHHNVRAEMSKRNGLAQDIVKSLNRLSRDDFALVFLAAAKIEGLNPNVDIKAIEANSNYRLKKTRRSDLSIERAERMIAPIIQHYTRNKVDTEHHKLPTENYGTLSDFANTKGNRFKKITSRVGYTDQLLNHTMVAFIFALMKEYPGYEKFYRKRDEYFEEKKIPGRIIGNKKYAPSEGINYVNPFGTREKPDHIEEVPQTPVFVKSQDGETFEGVATVWRNKNTNASLTGFFSFKDGEERFVATDGPPPIEGKYTAKELPVSKSFDEAARDFLTP